MEAQLLARDPRRATCARHALYPHGERSLKQGFTNIFKVLYKQFINR